MPQDFPRRDVLKLLAAAAALPGFAGAARAAGQGRFGPARPFSFDMLVEEARQAASRPYAPPAPVAPAALDRIDYDAHWRIQFRPAMSVPLGDPDPQAQFFHLGRYARDPVAIHLVEDGQAREILYTSAYFAMPEDSPARSLGDEGGFAGFRLMRPGLEPDWISFLGASYFRTDGPEMQYGLSARGLAVNTGLARPEEFPRFTAFWLAAPENADEDAVIYARLDSPSVTGAYRIGAKREAAYGGPRCDISCRLFFREGVERLGVAPLTSMYWYSETNRETSLDWRPEVHDSDGLAMHSGSGERLWRPLRNPPRVTASSFSDVNPKGFGLIQRDREFHNYQDDGVFYDRRPSVWVTPRGEWGRGAVQLVEIPTPDEIFDNIVAYWTPERQPAAGDALSYDYAQEWRKRDPMPDGLARTVATYVGWGGVPGQERPKGVRKIVVDFRGAALDALSEGVTPEVSASGGTVSHIAARPIARHEGWRLTFDVEGAETQPVELRAWLRKGEDALTETWTMLAEFPPR